MPTPLTLSGILIIVPWAMAATAFGQAAQPTPTTFPAQPGNPVRAELRAERTTIQVGQPVWVHFSLSNLTTEPVTLKVPDTPAAEETSAAVGLPLSHVFSGVHYSGLAIKDARGENWDADFSRQPRGPVPIIRLAPYGSVGVRVDLTQYYRSMRRPGKYTLIWRPYLAAVESAPLNITIMAERQAVITTEFGTMIIRFYFNEAPNTVENFQELIDKRFYDRLTFHKIIPDAYILGGDPRGDGRGGRRDGKRIPAEFNKIPFEPGTVGMARLPSDPDSASSQFFICTTRQPGYDRKQTAFGYLVGEESFKTLEQIASVPTDSNGKPKNPVVIRNMALENVPGREPELFGPEERNRPATTRPAIISGGMGSSQNLSQIGLAGSTTRPGPGTGG